VILSPVQIEPFPKFQDMFHAHPRQSRLHQPGGRGAQQDFTVRCDVIRVCMAYEHALRTALGMVRIQPEAQFRKMQITLGMFDTKSLHAKI